MTDLPATPKLPAIAKWAGIRNIARSVGRFVISQSEAVSEAIARHELRLAQVQALKDLMKADAAIVAKEKAKLVAKFAKGDAAERITIRRDIDELEGLFRRLHVYQQATNHLLIEAADVPKEGAEPKALDVPPIAESWLDRFDQLARAANEQWRSELLSQALAREAVQPGSIGTRALWFIGTIDERGFRHFATIADMCMHIGGEGEFGVAIPAIQGRLPFELAVPTSTPDPNLTIGEACFEISDLGLISDVSASSFRLTGTRTLTYVDCRYRATANTVVQNKGILLSPLGAALARLYVANHNAAGKAHFEQWIESVRGMVTIVKLS